MTEKTKTLQQNVDDAVVGVAQDAPTMGEGCNLPVSLDIGARATCEDGRCGRVSKLVVDPITEEVTDLIIEKGFLQKRDRVVPVSAVTGTVDGEIHLGIGVKQLRAMREYRDVEFRVPAAGWNHAQYAPEDVRHSMSPYDAVGGQSVTPSQRHHFHEGIDFGAVVLGRGTKVRCPKGAAGVVDHVLVGCENGHITHIVVKHSMPPAYHIIPISAIASVDDGSVVLGVSREEVWASPEYHPDR